MKILISIGLLFLAGCSSTKTISINSETVLNERVDWAITHNDSILTKYCIISNYFNLIGNFSFRIFF